MNEVIHHEHPLVFPTEVAEHLRESRYVLKPVKFSFKKKRGAAEGETKRPPVTLEVPFPQLRTIYEAMADNAKVAKFVEDLVSEAIRAQVLEQVGREDKPVNRQKDLDTAVLTLEAIASLEKSARMGSGISEEVWESFKTDYVSVMLEATGKPVEKLEKAADLFVGKLNKVSRDMDSLKFLQQQLAIWADKTSNLEEFEAVYSYLDNRLETLLNKENVSHLAALL